MAAFSIILGVFIWNLQRQILSANVLLIVALTFHLFTSECMLKLVNGLYRISRRFTGNWCLLIPYHCRPIDRRNLGKLTIFYIYNELIFNELYGFLFLRNLPPKPEL